MADLHTLAIPPAIRQKLIKVGITSASELAYGDWGMLELAGEAGISIEEARTILKAARPTPPTAAPSTPRIFLCVFRSHVVRGKIST